MYYRRKIILALLKSVGGRLGKTDLQKLLFLFVANQKQPSFDFLPFKFGCFSPQATQDLKTMTKYGLVEELDIGWVLKSDVDYTNTLKSEDQKELLNFNIKYKTLRGDKLIHHVYTHHPFFAIKSEIKSKILSDSEIKEVHKLIPVIKESCLFTIGYEGKSVEKYVTHLIKEDVKVLCDIRKNPLSMKFGFSKNQLKGILEAVGIEYLQVSGLGIESANRKELNSPNDYELLFKTYEKTTLVQNHKDLDLIANTLSQKKRVALTCFEADHHFCHRSRTANALLPLIDKHTPLVHL